MLNKVKRLTLTITLSAIAVFSTSTAYASFSPLASFGENPGELTASYFLPKQGGQSLVVLLHGCLQNGEQLATDIGLIGLAKKHKFSVLVPQQNKSNNITSCFNWFSKQDNSKDQGELLSLKNMILSLKQQYKFNHVYIAGLSAGGAMTSAMLINYPQLFSAGAVIAGVPYPCADELIKAISCMKNGPSSESELVNSAQMLIKENKLLPRLTVWTGTNDSVVNPNNAQALATQWLALTKNSSQPQVTQKSGLKRTSWLDNNDLPLLELNTLANIGHGITVNPLQENGGKEGDYLLKAPVATMVEIIRFFAHANNFNQQ